MRRRSRAKELPWFSALIGADQRETRGTSLDRRTLNLFLPLGRDVIAQRGIKESARALTMGTFSPLFSGVTAGVNRLFEAPRNWTSEAALLFFSNSCFKTQSCR